MTMLMDKLSMIGQCGKEIELTFREGSDLIHFLHHYQGTNWRIIDDTKVVLVCEDKAEAEDIKDSIERGEI